MPVYCRLIASESVAVYNNCGPTVDREITLFLLISLLIIGNVQLTPFLCAVINSGFGDTQQCGLFEQETDNSAIVERIRQARFFMKKV